MTLTQERLKEVLDYKPNTGEFLWKIARRGKAKKGSIAGANKTGGYRQIMIDGTMYQAHRLAWMYVYGKFPDDMIDHVNRQPGDNSIANLREATRKQNRENLGVPANNTSGFVGVYWVPSIRKWHAKIGHNKKRIHLGSFSAKDDAIHAVMCAKKQHFTHGSAF